MALLVNSTYTGIEHNDARPGAYTKTSKFTTWYGDQACLYEEITGAPVPGAGSLTATPHIHDGTNGAIIRIPLFHDCRVIELNARSSALSSGGTVYEGYYPFHWAPFYAPAGVSQIAVLLYATTETRDSVRCTIQDTSLATTDTKDGNEAFVSSSDPSAPTHWLHPGFDDTYRVMGWIMNVTAGAFNVVKIDAWDGRYEPGGMGGPGGASGNAALLPTRYVRSIIGMPVARGPHSITPAQSPVVTNDVRVKVPSAFTPLDAHLVANSRGISSYHLVTAQKNDAMLYELLTGRPAGNRSAATFTGHNHKDDASTSLNSSGADIDQALGSWGYGVLRPDDFNVGSADAMWNDAPAGDNTFSSGGWTGHGTAPGFAVGSSVINTDYTTHYHRVRIPAATTANLANSTGKLSLAALVFDDGVAMTVKAALGNKGASSFDTVGSAAASSGSGRQLITISGLHCSRPEEINALRIQLRYGTEKAASLAIYGTALAYEA